MGILLHHDPETKAVHVKTCVKGGAAQRDGEYPSFRYLLCRICLVLHAVRLGFDDAENKAFLRPDLQAMQKGYTVLCLHVFPTHSLYKLTLMCT